MGNASDGPLPATIDDALRKYLVSTVTSSVPLDICASKVDGAGSGVVALKALPAFVEVFRVNKPFATGSHNDSSVCDNCFANRAGGINAAGAYSDEGLKLLACKRCNSVRYCSKQCQISAWATHHKSECKEMAQLRKMQDKTPGYDRVPPTTRALYTAFSRIMRKSIRNELVPEERSAIANLLSHRDNYEHQEDSSIFSDFLQCPAIQPSFEANMEMSRDEKIDIYCKLMTNSMSIRQPNSEQSLGITLDLFSSMINHSCDPNVYFFVEGNQLRFRSSRPIAAGEELMISYTDPTYDVASRARELVTGYFFECSCRRCKHELAELDKVDVDDGSALQATLEIQEQILRSQRQIAFGGMKPNAIDAHMRKIIGGHTPPGAHDANKGWPESFQPMPDMRVFIARITQRVDPAYSLKTLLKLCFVTFPQMYGGRSGTDWIQAFALLAFTIRVYVKSMGRETYDWSLVYMIYLKAMVSDAEKCYGDDTAFVTANKRLLLAEKQTLPPEIARSKALVHQFQEDQKEMFAWAGIPDVKGVELDYTGHDII